VALAAAVFAGSLFFRLATFSITNDDYLHLSLAQQVILGDLPVRDFVDPGELLYYHVSAAAQVLFGRNLRSEVLLDLLMLSTGYALVYVLAFRATRSHVLGVLTTFVIVLLVPRLYSYPKVVLYAAALTLLWQYADDRRVQRLLGISLFTAVAFLFRHDHGAGIGGAAVALLVASHWREGWRPALRRVALYGVATAVALLPFFVFLQVNGGIVHYVRNALETGRAEYQRTVGDFPVFHVERAGIVPVPKLVAPRIAIRWADGTDEQTRRALVERLSLSAGTDRGGGTWQYDLDDRSRRNLSAIVGDPHVEDTSGIDRSRLFLTTWVHEPNVDAWFYYLTVVLPPLALVALALAALGAPAPLMTQETPKMIAAVVMAMFMHGYLLRAASDSAIADVSALTAVVGAWLLAKGLGLGRDRRWRLGWPLLRVTATVAVLGVTAIAASLSDGGRLLGQVARGGGAIVPVGRALEAMKRSAAPFDDDGARYLFACTAETDRVLVTTYAPAIHYQSGRGFAGGRPYFVLSFAASPAWEEFSLARLVAQRVPIVLTPGDEAMRVFAGSAPRIGAYVRAHYREAGEVDFGGAPFTVLADRRITPSGTFGADGLPCY
jgi:hypothetical protein